MDVNGIYNERISDFGCRKILGLPMPVSAYLNGCEPQGLNGDCYVSKKSCSKLCKNTKIALIITAITAGLIELSNIIKRKTLPAPTSETADKIKNGIFQKFKGIILKNKG